MTLSPRDQVSSSIHWMLCTTILCLVARVLGHLMSGIQLWPMRMVASSILEIFLTTIRDTTSLFRLTLSRRNSINCNIIKISSITWLKRLNQTRFNNIKSLRSQIKSPPSKREAGDLQGSSLVMSSNRPLRIKMSLNLKTFLLTLRKFHPLQKTNLHQKNGIRTPRKIKSNSFST